MPGSSIPFNLSAFTDWLADTIQDRLQDAEIGQSAYLSGDGTDPNETYVEISLPDGRMLMLTAAFIDPEDAFPDGIEE